MIENITITKDELEDLKYFATSIMLNPPRQLMNFLLEQTDMSVEMVAHVSLGMQLGYELAEMRNASVGTQTV